MRRSKDPLKGLVALCLSLSLILLPSGVAWAEATGSIVGWGDRVVLEPSAFEDIVALAAGGEHSLGLRKDGSVPVRLLSFTAERHASDAVIEWDVSDAVDHAGFHVYRLGSDGERVKLTKTLLTGQQQYQFVDATPPPVQVEYWLAELSRAGTVSWYGPARLLPAEPLATTRPVQASPNPARAEVTIRFSTATAGQVTIDVFDLSGRLVQSAPETVYDPGEHAWQWDGRDQTGAPVRAGLYFFVVRTGEGTQSGKIAIVR
jgi:hypothetical protein